MATQRYWGSNYWGANYWSSTYWSAGSGTSVIGQIGGATSLAAPEAASGSYWGSNYWSSNYWGGNYWKQAEPPGGSVFVGDVSPASEITGLINAQTDVTADFTGSVGQVVFFDLEVGFSVRWAFSETATYTGTIAPTLAAATSAFTGVFTENVLGSIGATIAAHTSDFSGTHVAPANTTGIIAADLDPLTPAFSGVNITLGTNGSIAATTQGMTGGLVGQVSTSDTDGTIGATLNAVDCNITGVFADADTVVGATISELAPVVGIFAGSSQYDFNIIEAEKEQDTLREGTRVSSRKGRSRVGTRRKMRA